MIKIIIVDDEPLAIDIIETYIDKIPSAILVARCNNALEANEILKSEPVDLMFLDIQMPGLTGIEFLKTLEKPPMTIFTTAYSEYALESYELNVVDYLLKPVSLERFIKAINKATAKMAAHSVNNDVSADTSNDFFFVKADKKLVKINFNEILYIEGLKDYVIIRSENSRTITLQTMKSLEEKLPTHQFRRIHRSYIVNMEKIVAVQGNFVEINEKGKITKLPVGKNYRDQLQDIIDENKL